MLKPPKKYGVDKNGFILTKASLTKIKKPFSKIVSELKDHLLDELEDQIHSIYVYGSVATGEAKVKTSDLDILIVCKNKPSPSFKSLIENLSEKLSKKYKTLVREVGVALSDEKEVRADTYGWGCFIKHLCVDIYGENLSTRLPKFKPTKKVAEAFNGDCGKVVEAGIKKLSTSPSKEEVLKICSSTMRKIVRTGFSLVMEQEKSWTTDLKKSYLAFAKYYPEQKAQMKEGLGMALTPTSDKDKLIKFLKGLKLWLPPLNSMKQIPPTKDLFGSALRDYWNGDHKTPYFIRRDDGYLNEETLEVYFTETPYPLEKKVIDQVNGKILDVGCGVGRNILFFQKKRMDVTGVDVSPLAIQVCKERGVKNAKVLDIFKAKFKANSFDTILLFGHNIGIGKTLKGATKLLKTLRKFTKKDGRLFLTSYDVTLTDNKAHKAYHKRNKAAGRYVGEIKIRLAYKGANSEWFNWLHVEPKVLKEIAKETKWAVQEIHQDNGGGYSAALKAI